MAFTQNQDTLRTLKLMLFLIIIEVLFMLSSVITVMANNKNADFTFGFTMLDISDFKWHESFTIKFYGDIPQFIVGGFYQAEKNGHTFIVRVPKGDLILLQQKIDEYNIVNQNKNNGFNFLTLLFATISFSEIPYPVNIIPILITTIVGFIIGYLAISEIRAWVDTLYPL